jgi:Kef-type K+ transport system membrane component KefB
MTNDAIAVVLLTLGAIFLAGLAADLLGRRTRLPRVTLLLLLGVSVGPIGFDLIPASSASWFPFIADLALVMVAFLLGGELTLDLLREHGRDVVVISLVVVAVTAGIVAAGLFALGWPPAVALLLGAISTSTDPAAIRDVVRENRSSGPFTKTLLGVVGVDDAWGIIAMSVALSLVLAFKTPEAASGALLHGLLELTGAILVGCALGVPMAMLTGRIRNREPTQAEALGGVLLCGGVALMLGVSFLLAAMTMGVVVANLARHHRRPFRAIEGIEWPFMVLFFVLSGCALNATDVGSAGTLTLAYILLRIVGRVSGGWLGARLSASKRRTPHSPGMEAIGVALLPQAGIAIGMALVVSQRLPEAGAPVLAATVAGTIVFEILGPIFTRRIVMRSGEAASVART